MACCTALDHSGRRKLIIRCGDILNKSESEVISKLANQVGYFPLFAMFQSLSKMVDMAVTATTGQKSGLSSSYEGDIKHILELTAIALSKFSERENKSEAESENKEYPVVVIDGFMGSDRMIHSPAHQKLFEELANFGAFLVLNGIAHVVFVSTGTGTWGHGANKVLSKGRFWLFYQ